MTSKILYSILFLVNILSLNQFCSCYSTGAPTNRCGGMMPGHNVEPLKESLPFKVVYKPTSSKNSFDGTFRLDK